MLPIFFIKIIFLYSSADDFLSFMKSKSGLTFDFLGAILKSLKDYFFTLIKKYYIF
jgi:hypothetical protein